MVLKIITFFYKNKKQKQMIYLNKNTTNSIILTLSESTDIVSPNFLFELTNNYTTTPEPIYFTTPDISLFTERYNKFILTDDDITGSTIGGNNISLNLKNGEWKYTIYVTTIVIDINTIDWNDYTEIETGRMIVNGLDTNIDPRYN
jgi:hypothetical protein